MPSKRTTTRLKFAVLAGGLVVAVMMIAVSAIFANAYGAQRAGDDASSLHRAETVLSASAILRSQTGQAALVAAYVAQTPGADPEDASFALNEAVAALRQFDDVAALYIDSYEISGAPDEAVVVEFSDSARRAIGALEVGDLDTARSIVPEVLDETYGNLIASVSAARDGTVNDLAEAQTVVGRVAEISRFLVAFLIPSAAILVYRSAARRQQRQQELETRLEAQHELNKAKDEFVASVSHELRTPLTSIYGFAQLLADGGYQDASMTKELVDLIRVEADELSRMVEDLLTAARADAEALAFHLEEFEAREGIEQALAPMMKAGAEFGIDAEVAMIHADDFRFRQIIRNLVSNARRYGGRPIGVRGVAAEGGYQVTVYDHGDGVAPHVEERLFQRFVHQGHQPLLVGSVGLGLSIVRLLAEGMNGSVAYERANGETRFVVTMPLAVAGEVGESVEPQRLAG